jgi:hypothetical protein
MRVSARLKRGSLAFCLRRGTPCALKEPIVMSPALLFLAPLVCAPLSVEAFVSAPAALRTPEVPR